jgi:transposase
MISLASGLRVYLACGVTDMRKGMVGLSMLVQQNLAEDPFDGAVYAFRGRRAELIKLIWHDGVGLCMLTKRLERGQFAWPSATTTGRIALSPAQLAALLDGCEWRAPAPRRRPELAG